MPAFGEIFTGAELDAVTDHVLSLSGQAQSSAAGAQLYEINCATCHQANGEGDRVQGAPALNDAIWLYGSDRALVRRQIAEPRHGAMPGWSDKLDPVTIKMLAAYVHSRGGGEAEDAQQDTDAGDAATEAADDVAVSPEAGDNGRS
jgi:cytochrome c oxidase cbb3-type subunit 3